MSCQLQLEWAEITVKNKGRRGGMKFKSFVHFDGNCREALAFYANVFDAKEVTIRLYGELPPPPEPMSQKDRERVAFACMKVKGMELLFSDYPPGKKGPRGGCDLFVIVDSAKKVDKLYGKLSEGGKPETEPHKAFWTKRYAVLRDRFGVRWHIARKNDEIPY